MRSLHCFIVKPVGGDRYVTEKEVAGKKLITSVSEEDHLASNREALVIDVPINYKGPIKPGNILLVHHNVFKFYNDVKGRRKSGKSFWRDDLFFIEMDQFFMYKSKDGWQPYDRYCFVKPIPPIQNNNIYNPSAEQPLIGEMKYPSERLIKKGINKGDLVGFTPGSEYEFTVDGEKLYRVYDHQITFKL